MINNKKIIGVCTTKVQDTTRSDYLNRLHFIAHSAGYKLIIFNSFVDFYRNDAFDEGSAAVYDLIDYSMVDALIVTYDAFCNKNIPDDIIAAAKQNNVPVVVINGDVEGCHCVNPAYTEAFKSMLDHVIKEHGVTDTFFIAGNRENDPDSVLRIQCYKEILEKNGIAFDENNVDYGGYWEDPTKQIIARLIGEGRVPPRAIFCANDHMAFTTIDELKRLGYLVPEDVIVTGFDGVPAAEHYTPQLTTCRQDLEQLAKNTVDVLNLAFSEPDKLHAQTYRYITETSESCGCSKLTNSDFRDIASERYRIIHEMEMHEDFEYAWIDRMLDISTMNELHNALSGCMLERSFVLLNSDFLASIMDSNRDSGKNFTDDLVMIPSKYTKGQQFTISSIKLSQLIPDRDSWLEDDTTYILSSIYVGSKVCGYYAVCTDNILYHKHKIKRVLKTINIAFNVAINRFRQDGMQVKIEKAALTNSISGMPNLKGAIKWFKEFGSNPENHEMPLSVSIYGIPKYSYIMENYGLDAIEDAVRMIAEALKVANPENCLIAQIAEDEFVIVNYYHDGNMIGDVIQNSTAVFFRMIEAYNTDCGKDYYVEVNCGCTVVFSGWDGSLEGYIKFAKSEMYMNRLKSAPGPVMKEQTASLRDYYMAFDLLVKKNLFSYHFQPIVCAKTGEIRAYEALMRTDASIGLNPLQVLDTAKEYNKLYDIEKLTLFNIMDRFASNQEIFGDKKVFINTIPGHFLNEQDRNELAEKYGEYMDRVVFELTEQDSVSDEELNSMKNLCRTANGGQIAIDDYGTGHSNIVNLMRYAPHIIKIDRFLITDIHKNQNKQMFVRSTVEFAKLNNIKVLAEGVETSNEMRTAIDLGVDYIQGYYTARPSPEPIAEISADIRREIIEANPLFGQDRENV